MGPGHQVAELRPQPKRLHCRLTRSRVSPNIERRLEGRYFVIGAVSSQDAEAGGHAFALPSGTKLQEFRLERVLGHGGFGITYLAKDTRLNETVAIKEYLPGELAIRVSNSTVRARSSDDQKVFNDGVYSFLEEARRVARVIHPNIMEVKKFFTMNGTAYIVLRYERGQTLKERLKTLKAPITEKTVRDIMDGLLQGLAAIHDNDKALLHRDVKPSNIILSRSRRENRETPVLIDFGAAREFASRNSRTVTALVTPGYSPREQYGAGGPQGPWTDLYALGATAYRCVTGDNPPDSLARIGEDVMVPAAIKAKGKYSDDLLRLIDWMMMVEPVARPQSAQIALQALRSSSMTIAAATATAANGLKISDNGPDHFVLQFDNPPESDVIGLAFKVTPPNQFLGPGKAARFQNEPHYFDLFRVESETGQVGFRGGPEIRKRITRGASVGISSGDGTINADAKWPLPSGKSTPGIGFSRKTIVTTALCLVAFGAAAMNIGSIQDTICDKTGFCTAQQMLFRTANECVARTPSCGIDACLGNFRRKATLPRLVSQMSTIETAANAACHSDDTAVYQKAKMCADQQRNTAVCEVAPCYTPYLSNYPNGQHIQEVRASVASARQACLAATPTKGPATPPPPRQTPAPVPPRAQAAPPPPPPVQPPQAAAPPRATPPPAAPPPQQSPAPAVALTDGTYNAVRTFTGPKSISDPASCPPSTNIQVTVMGSVITFEDFESNSGITRKWKGSIEGGTGISFLGTNATPPRPTYMTILGDYHSAEIKSKFCGDGIFKILR
jgi:serine/threonine protein kinase